MGSGILVVAALLFGVGPALVVVVIVVAVVMAGRTINGPSDAPAAARRHGAWIHAGAWACALLVPWVVVVAFPMAYTGLVAGGYSAVLAGLYPACPMLAYIGVHAWGERVWPRPSGQVRRAVLVPRRSPAPRWLRATTLGWAAALAAVLLVTGLTASDDGDLVHGSRVAHSYPGWPFGLAILVAVAVVGVATWATLRLVARRPPVTGDDEFDAASRQLTAHRVLRGVQLAYALTLAGVLGVVAAALSEVGLAGWGVVVGVLAGVAGVSGLGVALVPARAPVVSRVGAPAVGSPQPEPGLGAP